MLTQAQFNTLLIPMIYHHLDLGRNRVPSMRRRLFNVQMSSLAQENGVGLGGMSQDTWEQYPNKGVKGQLDFDQQYTQTYTHVEYPVTLAIQKKLVLNDQYRVIAGIIRRAGISAEQFMEGKAASLLNNAFNASYTLSDGKPLCSATHPKGINAGSGTFSNRGTSALTAAAISTTRIAMMRVKDDKSNEVGMMPNELWVPPELEDQAIKATRSSQDPDSGNNADNPQAGRWTVIPWLRLTDTTNWFVADGASRQEAVNWYEREAMQVMMIQENTTEIVYELKLHFSFGADDWRWIYGHEVSGS